MCIRDRPTAEYNMVQLEELGLLKMDFLGLRTLTVLKDAVKNVKASQGIDIDIDHIDLNDKKVLDFIGTEMCIRDRSRRRNVFRGTVQSGRLLYQIL